MALIPYAQRVVTQRKGDRRRGRSDRDDARYEEMDDDPQLEMRSDEYRDPQGNGDGDAADDAIEGEATE